jgi:hypothetical protein
LNSGLLKMSGIGLFSCIRSYTENKLLKSETISFFRIFVIGRLWFQYNDMLTVLGKHCSSAHKIFCCLLSQQQQTAPLQHLLLICEVYYRDGVYCSQVLYDIVQQDDDFWCVLQSILCMSIYGIFDNVHCECKQMLQTNGVCLVILFVW